MERILAIELLKSKGDVSERIAADHPSLVSLLARMTSELACDRPSGLYSLSMRLLLHPLTLLLTLSLIYPFHAPSHFPLAHPLNPRTHLPIPRPPRTHAPTAASEVQSELTAWLASQAGSGAKANLGMVARSALGVGVSTYEESLRLKALVAAQAEEIQRQAAALAVLRSQVESLGGIPRA